LGVFADRLGPFIVITAGALVGTLSETTGFRTVFWLLAMAIVGATVLGCLLWLFNRNSDRGH